MNHDLIVEQLFERCKWFMENILQAPAPPSRRQRLAGHLHPEATGGPGDAPGQDQSGGPAVEEPGHRPLLPGAGMTYVHSRTVSPQSLLGEECLPIGSVPDLLIFLTCPGIDRRVVQRCHARLV